MSAPGATATSPREAAVPALRHRSALAIEHCQSGWLLLREGEIHLHAGLANIDASADRRRRHGLGRGGSRIDSVADATVNERGRTGAIPKWPAPAGRDERGARPTLSGEERLKPAGCPQPILA